MSIKLHRRRAGFSLIEILFFVILATIVVVAGVNLATNFMRTVAFLTNTVELDTKSRLAADLMSRDIRQCDRIESASSNSIVLRLGTNLTTYIYRPDLPDKPLVRFSPEDPPRGTNILSGCDYVRFDLFKRQVATGAYDQYPPATSPAECKVVQLNWVCSRTLLGFRANSTTMQSAKVVIRKQ
jgi:hypothetical protein